MRTNSSSTPLGSLSMWGVRIALGVVIGAAVFTATNAIVDGGSDEATEYLVAQVEAVVIEPSAVGDLASGVAVDADQLDQLRAVSVIALDVAASNGVGGSNSTASGSSGSGSGMALPAPALAGVLGIEPSRDDATDADGLPELVRVDDFDPDMLPVIVEAARSEGEATPATFTDPCAEDEDVPCPDPGEAGTVMGSTPAALIGARPFEIWYGLAYWPSDGRCPSEDRAEIVPFGIWTGNPVETMQLRLWPEDRPDEVQVIELSTPSAERDEWLAVYAAATDPESIEGVLHCLELAGLEVETHYRFEIVATDVWGQFDAWPDTPGRFRVQPPNWGEERPPTLLLPLTANEIVVSAAARPEHSVVVDAYARNDEVGVPTDPCIRGRGGFYDNPRRVRRMNVSDVRMGSDYRWDRSFTTRQWGAMRLEEGRTYRLCVTWRVQGPSFDQGAEIVEGYDVITPDRNEFEITIESVTTFEPIERNALQVSANPVGRAVLVDTFGCGRWSNGTELVDGTITYVDTRLCVPGAAYLDTFSRGVHVRAEFTDAAGGLWTSDMVIPVNTSCATSCGSQPSELFYFELSLTTRVSRGGLCGTGPFGSCEDPDVGRQPDGSMWLRVDYNNTRDSGTSEWIIGDATDFGDRRPDLGPGPNLDVRLSPEASSTVAAIPVEADRPVTVQAVLVDPAGGELCLRPGGTGRASSETISSTHRLEIRNLCPQTVYGVILTLEDEAGLVTQWRPDAATSGGELWERGRFLTQPFVISPRASIRVDIDNVARALLTTADISVNGRELPYSIDPVGRCEHSFFGNTGVTPVEVGLEFELEVVVRVAGDQHSHDGSTLVCHLDRAHRVDGSAWRGAEVRLRQTVTFDDVRGTTIVLESTAEDAFGVRVEIEL